jgi:ElaB/YqjD/DUF883 family membrane-anchored ribosome-binding protein
MSMESTRDKLVEDFGTVLSEAETLLDKAGRETGERARDLRAQVEAKLQSAKERLKDLNTAASDNAREAARATDDYVHDHPWQAIGAAAAIGFLVGLMMNRR